MSKFDLPKTIIGSSVLVDKEEATIYATCGDLVWVRFSDGSTLCIDKSKAEIK